MPAADAPPVSLLARLCGRRRERHSASQARLVEQGDLSAAGPSSQSSAAAAAQRAIDYQMLYADSAPHPHPPPVHQRPVKESKSVDLPRKTLSTQPSVSGEGQDGGKGHRSVRRVSSFTFSNDGLKATGSKKFNL